MSANFEPIILENANNLGAKIPRSAGEERLVLLFATIN